MICRIDNVFDIEEWNIEELLVEKPLQATLLNHPGTYVKEFNEVCNALEGMDSYPYTPKKLYLHFKNKQASPSKSSIIKPPNIQLKPLPTHLKYVFLGENKSLPAIVSVKLNDEQVKRHY